MAAAQDIGDDDDEHELIEANKTTNDQDGLEVSLYEEGYLACIYFAQPKSQNLDLNTSHPFQSDCIMDLIAERSTLMRRMIIQ